jgi:hypothetical protein
MTCENTVLRRIFGPKGKKKQGDGEGSINDRLQNLFTSPKNIRIMKQRTTG